LADSFQATVEIKVNLSICLTTAHSRFYEESTKFHTM